MSFCARVICYADILCSAAEVSASSPSFGDVHSIVMLADSLTENLPEVAGHPATMSTFDDHFQQPPDTFAPWPPEFLTQLALMHTDNLFFYPYNSALQPAFTGTDCEAPMDAGWHVDLLGKFTSSGRSRPLTTATTGWLTSSAAPIPPATRRSKTSNVTC